MKNIISASFLAALTLTMLLPVARQVNAASVNHSVLRQGGDPLAGRRWRRTLSGRQSNAGRRWRRTLSRVAIRCRAEAAADTFRLAIRCRAAAAADTKLRVRTELIREDVT